MKYKEFKNKIENFHYDDGIYQIGAGYFTTTSNYYWAAVLDNNGLVFATISNTIPNAFAISDTDALIPTQLMRIIFKYADTHIGERGLNPNYSDLTTETICNNHIISLDSTKNNKPKTITKDFIEGMKKKNVDSEISKDRRTITLKRNGKTIAHVSTVIRYKASIMVDLPKDLAEPILKYTSTSAKDRGETPADPNDVNMYVTW